uniref:Uncharacterized protein n=1 Tax=Trypanosoma congolense (strain IL3000) TaxID=1068625 RepID=G0ULA4_TRYCI|nr:conserved hypothetical protein [Trypanosoma congolense IL3000]
MHQTHPILSSQPCRSVGGKFEIARQATGSDAARKSLKTNRSDDTFMMQVPCPLGTGSDAPVSAQKSTWKAKTSIGHSTTSLVDNTVIDPLHALHLCIRHFLNRPDVYGSDIRALLDRELMYVMRVKASESALLSPATIPVCSVALPPITNSAHDTNKSGTAFLGKCSNWVVAPRSVDAAVNFGAAFGSEGMFGLGGVNLTEGSSGLFSLLERNKKLLTINEQQQSLESGEDKSSPVFSNAPHDFEEKNNINESQRLRERFRVHFSSPDTQRNSEHGSAGAPKLLIDGAGYEISFLRSQLHQVEAAYNAKCIRLHELQQECVRYMTDHEAAESQVRQQNTKINELTQQLENAARELQMWKTRASEITLHDKGTTGRGPAETTHRVQATQFLELKRDYTHMSQLWRETEKSLQETRRLLESAEKETRVSHRYLSDAFFFIEKLERRIKRRDIFIEKQRRWHTSMQEKYEKILWCLNETQILKGAHSYVDYLLSEDDVWSMFLFVRLQSRLTSFSHIEEASNNANVPLYFRRTPMGGKFLEPYSPELVHRLVVEGPRENINDDPLSKMSFPFTVPHWRGPHAIGYTSAAINANTPGASWSGSDDLRNESCRRTVHLLTLASAVLPMQLATTPSDAVVMDEDIPNSGRFDQTTIRFLLYQFWEERLTQYKRELDVHLQEHIKASHKKCALGVQSCMGMENEVDGNGSAAPFPGFLTALVDYVHRIHPPKIQRGDEDAIPRSNKTVYVRSVISKVEGAPPSARTCFPYFFQREDNGQEVAVSLSPQAREMLFAFYYYAEEYKDSDSDLRLFYLVAHQQLPELVAINFYASIEALRIECDELIRQKLCGTQQRGGIHGESVGQANDMSADGGGFSLLDSPAEALLKASAMVDAAPLIEEGTTLECDSDGEGYGVVLPGLVEENQGEEDKGAWHETGPSPLTKLKHNISLYLHKCKEEGSCDGDTVVPSNVLKPEDEDATEAVVSIPKAWAELDQKLQQLLAPHSSLLTAFKKRRNQRPQEDYQSRRRRLQGCVSSFSCTRYLIPVDSFMQLLHKHCFSTYALSCSGSARSSLLDSIFHPTGGVDSYDVDPLTRVGQLPPSENHIRRLRFAIALDQPSSLVRYSDLFNINPQLGVPTHFYDEYLKLTINTYLEQQEAYMNIILGSCISQTNRGTTAALVDAAGSLPFPALRLGFDTVFKELSLGPKDSNSLSKHFLGYCDLLRNDEDIRKEQFTDAPLLLGGQLQPQDDFDHLSAILRDEEWSVQHEAASCPLLLLSYAARMVYIVWGLTFSLESRRAILGLPEAARNFVSRGMALERSQLCERDPKSEDVVSVPVDDLDAQFRAEVDEAYQEAVNRVRMGCGQQNDLRRLLSATRSNSTPSPITNLPGQLGGACESPSQLPLHQGNLLRKKSFGPFLDISQLFALFGGRQRQGWMELQAESIAACSRRSSRCHKRASSRQSPSEVFSPSQHLHFSTGMSLLRFLSTRKPYKGRSDRRKSAKGQKALQDAFSGILWSSSSYENTMVHYQEALENLIASSSGKKISLRCLIRHASTSEFTKSPSDAYNLRDAEQQSSAAVPGGLPPPGSAMSVSTCLSDGQPGARFETGVLSPSEDFSASPPTEFSVFGSCTPMVQKLHVASAVLSML